MTYSIPDVRFRPLLPTEWPGPRTPEPQRSPFSASWSDTLRLLERELGMLEATGIVIQVALREDQIRSDGWPKQGHAQPPNPGVVLAFDSRHGPLKYATDRFHRYEDNVRAIALGLEALRKVDRYGISTRGEQYAGWKALPSGHSDMGLAERGAALVEEHGSIRAALKATHPDVGGDAEDFRAVMALKEGS